MAWPLKRRQADPAAGADQQRDRAETEERERQERQAREARRDQAAARRRQVAGQLAAAALSWSFNAWLEGAMWVCLFLGLVVLYIGSYTDLAATFAAFGYDPHISWLMPLGIDLPVTASVLAQLMAGRWQCGWWVRVRLGVLTAVTAPLTLVGNGLRGAIDASGHFVSSFHVELWMYLLAFAVPGLGVVLIGYVASMMQGERAELTRRRLEGEAMAAAETAERTPGRGAASGSRRSELAAAKTSGPSGPRPGRPGRRPASEVLELVRTAREHLAGELGRKPSDEEIAARMTADGHPLAASRVRFYLPKLRSEERSQPATKEPGQEEEVVAWHAR